MTNKKFLILGHPRSGTGFAAKLFQRFGYNVEHEKMGKDGISSWMFAVEDYQVYPDLTLNRKDFTFDYIIMNLRNPIDMISSTYYTENTSAKSLRYRQKHINLEGLNDVELAVKSVLEWYKLIELQRPHLKLFIDKNPEEKLFYFLERFEDNEGLLPVEKIVKKENARAHPDLDHLFLEKNCHPDLLAELEIFCHLYDYPI